MDRSSQGHLGLYFHFSKCYEAIAYGLLLQQWDLTLHSDEFDRPRSDRRIHLNRHF